MLTRSIVSQYTLEYPLSLNMHTQDKRGMSNEFLAAFMHAAREITSAERGLAVDRDFKLQDRLNLPDETLQAPRFANLANITLRQAMDQNEPIVTNNIITSPSEAPVTNTNFSDLRVVIVIPVEGIGAVYLDQHIRQGVIPRDIVEALYRLAQTAVAGGYTHLTSDELVEMYRQQRGV
jgi:hypothetical protein